MFCRINLEVRTLQAEASLGGCYKELRDDIMSAWTKEVAGKGGGVYI